MAKKKLLIEYDYDFLLFGISCSEKLYRICWALNNQLKLSLVKDKDIEVVEKNQIIHTKFPVFFFHQKETLTEYRVISNKIENKLFVSEFKQADYLFVIQGNFLSAEKTNILKKIKEVAFVQTAFEINPQQIKSKDNFIF